ncbi:MAG: serine hydrolase domain-containing protein [Bacteroidota bacterium]
MKAYWFSLAFLILSFSIFAQSKSIPLEQANRITQKTFEEKNFPGMAVAVWKDGELLMSKGYGYANIKEEITVDPAKSKFRIGSISKPVTAAALAKLYEADAIDLDQPIQTYVPDFPKKKWDINLRQLAGHLAGIRHYKGMEFMSNKYYPTVEEGLDIFKNDPLLHEPSSKYSYSSYGWNLISAAIESAAEKPFLAYMEEEVFEALEMTNTQAEHSNQEIDDVVSFYIQTFGKNILAPKVDNSYKWAGGGFISTAEDVIKFGVAHLSEGYLQSETLQEWTATQYTKDGKPTNYGIGWRSGKDKKNRAWYGHSGGSVGGTSMLLIYPEEKIVVVTLVNLSSAKMGDLAFRLANQFLAKASPKN